jgi:adenylosuccinate synthase
MPVVADQFAACKPVYEEWPGWQESTVGVTAYDALPDNAKKYLDRMQELAGVPVDIVSTGPGREQTIIRQHPFE